MAQRRVLTHRQHQRELREVGDRLLLRSQLVRDTVLTSEQLFRNYIAVEEGAADGSHEPVVSATPTPEDILNSPLAKFIKFAAMDSGFADNTRDLIVKWVHPLFLKAKAAASKEDNPNYWQAMNGPFAE